MTSIDSADPLDRDNFSQEGRPIELIFGLVGPTGVNNDQVASALKEQLAVMNYKVYEVSLSKAIKGFTKDPTTPSDEFERIESLMNQGDKLRKDNQNANIVAVLGLVQIRKIRETITGDSNQPSKDKRVAYIVRTFKRPEEVELFRDVYGKAFTLISIYVSRQTRISNLVKKLAPRGTLTTETTPEQLALKLILRDHNEDLEKFGQRVSTTFPIADYFVLGEHRVQLEKQLSRLIRLIFGDPYISPSLDEQSMFFAQSAALRSLDLSRQVGASIVDDDGVLLSTGCNEVPKAGGGLYWSDDTGVNRDYELGEDANVRAKKDLLIDALRRLNNAGLLNYDAGVSNVSELAESLLFDEEPILGDSKLFDVIEFGRSVHAEMASISSAARTGVSLQGSRLFCTTFPCHLCARHIVASGIKEVVFIEPYEKSRVSDLYRDSIVIEPQEKPSSRVVFRSFFGVAPRRYFDFFQPVNKRKNKKGAINSFNETATKPRLKRLTFTYTLAEALVINNNKPKSLN